MEYHEWKTHSQVGEQAQQVEDKPWENKKLREEEAMPKLRVEDVMKAAMSHNANTGV